MNEALELLKKAVEIIEAKLNIKTEVDSNLVELASLPAGSHFKTDIGNFIVLEHNDGETKVITEDIYVEDEVFGECTDYRESKVKKLCDGDILGDFELVFGAENIIEHEADLTTLEGQNVFGSVRSKVRPLTFDEARKYNAFLVNKELDDCYWTITTWSTGERGWKYSVVIVSPSGRFNINDYRYGNGVRPFCILKSNILVSKED